MPYAHRIEPGQKVKLKDIDPNENGKLNKEQGESITDQLGAKLRDLQDLMFEADMNSLLVVLQGRDTSGKDGAIRCLAEFMNMQGCSVATFKQPSDEELAHDFLWRVHAHAPAKGHATVFNRSHYEDVIVVRVHDLIPKEQWRKRYVDINNFERLLHDSGTIIVKFYLHISKEEQEERLLEREKEVEKSWKLSVGDWQERELWGKYTDAFEDALEKCSTEEAPWYVVPANHKWFRNLAVVETLVETLKPFRKVWQTKLQQIGKERKAELEEFRAKGEK